MSRKTNASIEKNFQIENSCDSESDENSSEENILRVSSLLAHSNDSYENKTLLITSREDSFVEEDCSSIPDDDQNEIIQHDRNLPFQQQNIFMDCDINLNDPDEMRSEPRNSASDYSHKKDVVSKDKDVSKQKKVHKLICPYCSKCFKTLNSKLNHVKSIHKVRQSFIACQYCDVSCKDKVKLQEHYKHIHNKMLDISLLNVGELPKTSTARVKCIECNITFGLVQSFRDHLTTYHDLEMTVQELFFPNVTAFKKWKLEIERKNLVHYYSPHGAKKLSCGIRRVYSCHRSGIYSHQAKSDRKRANRLLGTRKTGVMCTSEIICYECPSEVYVKYCPNHYGHGKETPYLQLSAEEQAAIQENILSGISFQEQVDDIRNGLSEADHYRAGVIKKRDMCMIERAFAAENYDTGMTDIESVEQWIQLCYQMETFPVLSYQPESSNAKEKSFMLTIMTEYQKYILVASSKQVVCIHSYFRFKVLAPSCLTVLFVMDEYNVAFPVAFCISSKLDKNVLLNFLLSIKKVTGPLSCTYLMTNSEDLYYEAWQEVMCDDSTWVWSIWSMDNDFQVHLRRLLKDVKKRENTYTILRKLLECNNEHVFSTMFKNLIASLLKDPDSKSFGEFLLQKYGSNAERWACCYRKDIKLSTNIFLESLHRTISYCSKMIGRKVETYRLSKLLLVLLKWVRYKMLDRFTNLDNDKLIMAKDTISACHDLGLEISCEAITELSDKAWLILSEEVEDKVYVTRDFETCPELCDLKCSDCDVCVHMFSCSCIQSLINANMCPHIHAVVWKLLTPHFSPPASPTLENSNDVDLVIPNNCPELLENILKRMSDVYKKVRENKYKLNQEALSEVLKMLNRCHDICSEKEVVSKSDSISQTSLTLLSHPSNVSNAFSHIPNRVKATTSSFNLSDISSNSVSNTPYVIETISPSTSSSNKSNDFESHTPKSTKSSILSYRKLNISKDSLNKLISQKHQKIKATTSASKKAYYLKAIIKPNSSSSNIPNSSLNTKTSPCVLHVTPDRLLS